ncbi:uncharacterized protein G2W53_020483 [Senna tora]|uniref:Uncharacterized protein n=1 Tax=Senna tora TaxID=362788 RepID=A0A834U387_9FABA|nr:uncharacterized protein G2W53_020483 [Senna tora]
MRVVGAVSNVIELHGSLLQCHAGDSESLEQARVLTLMTHHPQLRGRYTMRMNSFSKDVRKDLRGLCAGYNVAR